jgi:hypothetical protein
LFGVDHRRLRSLAFVDHQHVGHLANHLHLLVLPVLGASRQAGQSRWQDDALRLLSLP